MATATNELTTNAREYAEEVYFQLGRETVVTILTDQLDRTCYKCEDLEETLIPLVVDAVEAGIVEFDWSEEASHKYPGMMWMDHINLDKVWIA